MRTDAIGRWSDELARNPTSLAFLPLGEELRRRRRFEEARRVALLGLERHPYRPEAHDLLARICADVGDEQRARDEWEMALELDPWHLSSLKGLGFLAYRRHDLAGAERLLRAARTRDPEDPGLKAAHDRVQQALRGGVVTEREGAGNEGGNGRSGLVAESGAAHALARGAPGAAAAPLVLEEPISEPATQSARTLFAALLGEEPCTALLLDRDGLVLAGAYVDESGADVADAIGGQLSGVGEEAARALGHLGLGAWESLLVETEHANLALGPVGTEAIVLVAAARDAQVGFVRRLLDRACRRAASWLEGT